MEGLIPLSSSRKTIRDQVAQHPLVTFVALAYTISWGLWLLVWFLDLGLHNGLFFIGVTGPALAATIVSAIMRPELPGGSAKKRWQLFGMIGICVLAVLSLRRLWLTLDLTTVAGRVATDRVYPSFTVFLLDVLAAGVVAFVLSGTHSPRQGVRNLLHSLNPRQSRVGWYWFVIALGLYPVVIALGNFISARVGLAEPALKATGLWYLLALDVMLVFFETLFGGGGLEEPGWRGFALPLLQERYSPLRSSLILAVIWAFWHWPMFWFGFFGGGPLGVFFFLLGVAPSAILFTAIFNRAGGSLLIVILLHTSINITPIFLPVTMIASGLWWLLMLCVALWMWRSPQTFSSEQVENKYGGELEKKAL